MHRSRVLIVEDEFLVAYELSVTLEDHGLEVCGMVGSGEEAVRLAERARPHCVLMDVSLKGDMGGVEAARRIVARHRVPVVFMTGLPAAQVMAQARDVEPAACLAKPVDPDELCRTVLRLVARTTRATGTPAELPSSASQSSPVA